VGRIVDQGRGEGAGESSVSECGGRELFWSEYGIVDLSFGCDQGEIASAVL
jgi:hypothetical protein